LIRWYADNFYLHGIWGAEIEDIIVFGGIALDKNKECSIASIMESAKKTYEPGGDFPVKWNIKDLKSFYERKGLADLYKVLLEESKYWRRKIFEEASDIKFTIIIAMIKAHSTRRRVIKKIREKLTRYVFSDALMRVGHHAKEINASGVEIILDWPEENQPRQIFDEEYQSAFSYGITCEKQEYHCGALKALGFADFIYFSGMKTSSLLQFCDLVVGATRDFVDIALEREKDTFGFECLRELRMKIRGAPDNVMGRGLIVAPTKGKLIQKVRDYSRNYTIRQKSAVFFQDMANRSRPLQNQLQRDIFRAPDLAFVWRLSRKGKK
jgi:hypothetical protein